MILKPLGTFNRFTVEVVRPPNVCCTAAPTRPDLAETAVCSCTFGKFHAEHDFKVIRSAYYYSCTLE